MNVVIVESPAKAKTINKYLGPGYQVLASYGHVRDLPSKDGSVEPDNDFAHDLGGRRQGRQKRLDEIAEAVKGADKLILATDPDREGEAISWHVLEVLKERRRPQGPADRARGLQRHHQEGRARGDRSTPRQIDAAAGRRLPAPAARSTTWSASRSRRCCGASCPAPARPAACSRWRCGWSATASARSRISCRRNTGPS